MSASGSELQGVDINTYLVLQRDRHSVALRFGRKLETTLRAVFLPAECRCIASERANT